MRYEYTYLLAIHSGAVSTLSQWPLITLQTDRLLHKVVGWAQSSVKAYVQPLHSVNFCSKAESLLCLSLYIK